MSRLSKDQLIGGVIAALGMCTLGMSFTIGHQMWGGESSRLFPLIVSVVLIGLGGGLFLTADKAAPVHIKIDPQAVRLLCLMGVGVLYTAALGKLGYIIPTAIAMPVVFYLFGLRSWVGLAASVVLGPLAYHLIFFVALKVYPPYAPWLDIPFLSGMN